MAIRTKWEEPPQWAYSIAYIYILLSILNYMLPSDRFVEDFWIGQYFLNPLGFLASLFIIYCFMSIPVLMSSNRKTIAARYLWITYFALFAFQDVLYYFLVVLPETRVNEIPFNALLKLQLNGLITNLVVLGLHVIFPEAVLYSHEQIIREQNMYKFSYKANNFVSRLGINVIDNYLESALELLEQEKPSISS